MKRKHEIQIELNLTGISWLVTLAQLSNGALLAIILYKLEQRDLCSIRCTSKTIKNVCDRYEMMDRLYTDSVYMFGDGKYGKLGDDDTSHHGVSIPRRVAYLSKVASVSCSDFHTGIVTVDGDVFMFGNGSCGRLGDGDTSDHDIAVPRQIQNIPKVAAISCGDDHTGILTVDGDVYMCGDGSYGQLGDGDTSYHEVGIPVQIPRIPKVASLSCGEVHTGIITVDGDVYMFGHGTDGKLGDKDTSNHRVAIPVWIQGIPKIVAISCGSNHTGIITVDGDVYMFGKLGTDHQVGVPRQIQGIPKVASISCGDDHTGIVTVDGDAHMFGNGIYGKLGDGYVDQHDVGVFKQIQGIPKVTAVSCGYYYTGLVTVDGKVYMFGNGSHGTLGDGDTTWHSVRIPKRIRDIPKIASISCCNTHTGIVTVAESALNLSILH